MSLKNKDKNNKKSIKRTLILLFVDIIILCLLVFGVIKVVNTMNTVKKDELTLYLEDMGKEFYEDFYYEQLGSTLKEKENFLSMYEEIGIKISLDTLSKYKGNKFKDIIDKFINKETNIACDRTTTKVIIYPTSPYEKDSYKIETEIDC